MELGSTICTPRPKCDECPIKKTCRAYAEGLALAKKESTASDLLDIEDACSLCEQLDTEDLVTAPDNDEVGNDEEERGKKKRKTALKVTNTISQYFAVSAASPSPSPYKSDEPYETSEEATMSRHNKRKAAAVATNPKSVLLYCSLFPKKVPKKKVAEEEAVVCMIELRSARADSKWLIEQRPAKGKPR